MRLLLFFLFALCPLLSAQSLALDVFNGDDFEEVTVPLGANSLLGFGADGQPARITAGAGISISGNVITSSGSGSSTLEAMTDVTFSSKANNQLLRYNFASSKWVNWTPDFLVSSDLSGYLTSATAATTYAQIDSPTFTGVVTIPSGASIADYVTTADPYILGTLTWEHPNTTLGTQTSALTIADEQEAMAWQMPAESGRLLTVNSGLNGSNISSGTVAAARLGSGSGITTKYLRGDNTWQTISGGGDALTSGTLAQFAPTTSAQLRGVLSDESGTGDFLTTNGSAASLTSFPTLNQSTTGNAATATALQTGRTLAITGDLAWTSPSFDGSANVTAAGTLATVATAGTTGSSTAIPVITINAKGLTTGITTAAVIAPAGTLTGTTLASNVVTSSLTSLGTITTGVWQGSIIAPAYLGTGSSITTKYLRGDGTWQTIGGGGDALTSGTLAQFAPTTSAQLRGVLSDESGTGDFLTTNGSAAGLTSFPTFNQSTTGNAATATALQTGRTLAITGDLAWTSPSFDGSANVTAAGTLATVATAGTTGSSTAIPVITINAKGLTTGITTAAVIAPAGTLTGTTLASNVVTSSLTSLGTISTGVWQGTAIADSYIASASTWNAKLTTTGNGSGLTGLTQSQISGLTTTDRASFANVRPTHSTLTYAGTTDIDMDGNGFQTLTLTGNVTFTTSNRAAGRSKTLRIIGDSSLRTFTFPGGWTWVGAAAPASIAASKDAILTITAFGSADSDIVAAYAVEP